MSALHFAANAGHLEVVKVLLDAKADLHALDEVSRHSFNVLHVPPSSLWYHTCAQNGSTPFHWAAANCHLDVAEALLAAGANIDAADKVSEHDLFDVLIHAPNALADIPLFPQFMSDLCICFLFASLIADVQNGLTALLWAADLGHMDVLELLLRRNANIHAVDVVSTHCCCCCCSCVPPYLHLQQCHSFLSLDSLFLIL